MKIKNSIKNSIKSSLAVCLVAGLTLLPVLNSTAAQHGVSGLNFQALPINCVDGFKKKAYKKAPNGMVTKMVCKTPVLTCPENTAPGISMLAEPKVKLLGGGDDATKFRFVYTCKYYKVEG